MLGPAGSSKRVLLNTRSARIGAGAEGLGSELDSDLLSEMICIPI